MSLTVKALVETHHLGARSQWRAVRQPADDREWLARQPTCELLERYAILHVGMMEAAKGFRVIRRDQSGTFFMATLAGEGEVLADGNWRRLPKGQACLLPPHNVNAILSNATTPWHFCWVRYVEPRGHPPVARGHSPSLGAYPQLPLLAHAIEGLIEECRQNASPAGAFHWVELIQHYVLAFAQPRMDDDRLSSAWEIICSGLGHAWSLEEMARGAHVSPEHFRRLCLRDLGRSPMKHLTYLRMRHAAELLSSTDEKVETISRMVGYENPFSFSNTFLKWTGFRPSEHRRESS